jgi:hypothetical protein
MDLIYHACDVPSISRAPSSNDDGFTIVNICRHHVPFTQQILYRSISRHASTHKTRSLPGSASHSADEPSTIFSFPTIFNTHQPPLPPMTHILSAPKNQQGSSLNMQKTKAGITCFVLHLGYRPNGHLYSQRFSTVIQHHVHCRVISGAMTPSPTPAAAHDLG